eukprot:7887198-Karenia_brevis.AAC.1
MCVWEGSVDIGRYPIMTTFTNKERPPPQGYNGLKASARMKNVTLKAEHFRVTFLMLQKTPPMLEGTL